MYKVNLPVLFLFICCFFFAVVVFVGLEKLLSHMHMYRYMYNHVRVEKYIILVFYKTKIFQSRIKKV